MHWRDGAAGRDDFKRVKIIAKLIKTSSSLPIVFILQSPGDAILRHATSPVRFRFQRDGVQFNVCVYIYRYISIPDNYSP